MELIPIRETEAENKAFHANTAFHDILAMTLDFYTRVGYTPPWIGYFASEGGQVVGVGGFKGAPRKRVVEFAYGTFKSAQHNGIGTKICRELIELAKKSNPDIIITARTLPEKNFSTRILEKNGFTNMGPIEDPEDGIVWEWVLQT
jgi:RimJ/RimL family protein N-acetyltransferase